MNDSVVAIVSAFFIIGITVGIIAVVALSALRADRRAAMPPRPSAGVRASDARRAAGGPGWDNAGRDDHPRWPGDDDNDFSSE